MRTESGNNAVLVCLTSRAQATLPTVPEHVKNHSGVWLETRHSSKKYFLIHYEENVPEGKDVSELAKFIGKVYTGEK